MESLETMPSWFLPLMLALLVWEAVWKMLALWRAARNSQPGWFIAIGIINSLGILPIVYLLMHPAGKTGE